MMAGLKSGACVALALFVVLGSAPVLASEEHTGPPVPLPPAFKLVSQRNVLGTAYDLLGPRVAWASLTQQSIEILLTDLDAHTTRVLSSIPVLRPDLKVESLALDAGWVVWSDNRFGTYDVFALNLTDSILVRLTESSGDDTHVDASDGMAVWNHEGSLRVANLTTRAVRPFSTELGAIFEPSMGGGFVAWAQSNKTERYVNVRGVQDAAARQIGRAENLTQFEPVAWHGYVVWRSVVMHVEPGKAPYPEGSLIRLAGAPDWSIQKLTDEVAALESATVGGGRVAWLESSEGKTILHLYVIRSQKSSDVDAAPAPPRLSESYVVLSDAGGPNAHLYYLPLEKADKKSPGPGLPSVLACAALIGLLLWRRRSRAA